MTAEEMRNWYYRRILGNVPFILSLFDEGDGVFRCEPGKDAAYRHCLRPLAYLYKNPGEGNGYRGDRSVLEKIIRQGDFICDEWESRGGGLLGVEWIPYNLMECIEFLGDELGGERTARWRGAVAGHLDAMKLVSNYISTAPNHFIWRAALLYRAGQLFGEDGWCESGRFLARQVCRMQTADGYWDEAHRGQGPSTNYHRTMLHGLDLYYRFSGDEEVRDALYGGIDFAVRAAYPDGTPIETFDGRQPYLAAFAVAMAANAISRTGEGRRLLARQAARLDELGVADATRPCGFALTWYAFAATDFMLDCYRFFEEGGEGRLPAESEGHSDTFGLGGADGFGGGAVGRRGKWFLAVSAAETDVPRFIPNVFITERQSGISLWHADAGLVAGGGNRMRNHVPLANAHVITGWKGVDCIGGVFPDEFVEGLGLPNSGGTTTEHGDPVKCCYHPIRRRAEMGENGGALHLDFMHARIRLDLRVESDERIVIGYWFEAQDARKVLLQIPVPLFHPGVFAADGREHTVGDVEDVRTVELSSQLELSARGRSVRYTPAEDRPYFFTWPLEPIKNWEFKGMNYVPDVYFKPLYTVGLISAEFREKRGEGILASVEIGK